MKNIFKHRINRSVFDQQQEEKKETLRKDTKKLERRLATTLGYLDIESVQEDHLVLSRSRKKMYVKGIVIEPHNIFVDEVREQSERIRMLRSAFNGMPDELYFGFVYSEIDAEEHIAYLNRLLHEEEDPVSSDMIRADLEKLFAFQMNARQLHFYIMVRAGHYGIVEKLYDDLLEKANEAGMKPVGMRKNDFLNYVTFVFGNDRLSQYYYARSLFSTLENSSQGNDPSEPDLSEVSKSGKGVGYDKRLLSGLAPAEFGIHEGYLRINDQYVYEILVRELPKQFYLGILCEYLNDPHIKVSMKCRRAEGDIARYLRRSYDEQLRTWNQTSDPTMRARLEEELKSLQGYIDQVVRNHDRTWDVYIVFSVWSDSRKEAEEKKRDLKQRLHTDGFLTFDGMFLQEELFRMTVPFFIDDHLNAVMRNNYAITLPSDGLAGLYPWVFEMLKDPQGLFLARERQNGGIILFDPFFYIHEAKTARYNGRYNGNIVVAGKAGSGKTTAMNMIIRNFISRNIKTVWIDPENRNKTLCETYNGTFIDWGKRGNLINPFDLVPISSDEESDEEKKWDTELAIFNAIENVSMIFQYLYPDMDEDMRALIGVFVKMAYAACGLVKDENGRYPSFRNMSTDDMPTFRTFHECLISTLDAVKEKPGYEYEYRLMNSLSIKMSRILNEWSVYFVGHTTIRPEENARNIIAFGTKQLFNAPENLQNAMYHIMFTYAWSLCLDEKELSSFVIDEAHTLILKGETAKLVSQFYRRSRKYCNVMLVGTQEPGDFAEASVVADGKAIFNNSVYKLFFGMNKDACNDVRQLEDINETERTLIQQFHQGDALFLCGNRRIPIHVMPSRSELNDMGAMFTL